MVAASQREDIQHLHRVPSNFQHGSYNETRAIRICELCQENVTKV